MNVRWTRRRPDLAQAGIESVPFGILILFGGMLLAFNLWSIVDTRGAVDAAARDYLRAYTSAASPGAGDEAGTAAATATLEGHGRKSHAFTIDPPHQRFGPCRPATVTVAVTIRSLRVPFIGGIGETTVSATQSELIQPYSMMAAGIDRSLDGTACAE